MPTIQIASSRLAVDFPPFIARIVLRNPPLNVIDIPMMEELSQSLAEVESRPDVSVIVFSSDGKAFSAGVDVAAHTPDKVEEMLTKFHAVIRAVVATKKVTIAAVHGHSLGGGAELAMVCDIVCTTESAQWGFPEIKLGCYPPVACTALAALVGQKRAAELILTGRTITGKEAAEIGLANPPCSTMNCLSRWTNVSDTCASSARWRWRWLRKRPTLGTRCTLIKVWLAPSGSTLTN